MPWCDNCDRLVEGDELTDEGECPTCNAVLTEHRKVPWHFKLMIAATIVYLGYRAYQGVEWLAHHA
ncbi:MAG: hypothetical protein ACYDA2_02640 [Acidimicrobiales bacterium]